MVLDCPAASSPTAQIYLGRQRLIRHVSPQRTAQHQLEGTGVLLFQYVASIVQGDSVCIKIWVVEETFGKDGNHKQVDDKGYKKRNGALHRVIKISLADLGLGSVVDLSCSHQGRVTRGQNRIIWPNKQKGRRLRSGRRGADYQINNNIDRSYRYRL